MQGGTCARWHMTVQGGTWHHGIKKDSSAWGVKGPGSISCPMELAPPLAPSSSTEPSHLEICNLELGRFKPRAHLLGMPQELPEQNTLLAPRLVTLGARRSGRATAAAALTAVSVPLPPWRARQRREKRPHLRVVDAGPSLGLLDLSAAGNPAEGALIHNQEREILSSPRLPGIPVRG